MKLLLEQSKENGADLKRLHREVGELSTRMRHVERCLERQVDATHTNEEARLRDEGAGEALSQRHNLAEDRWARWIAFGALVVGVAGLVLPVVV